MSSAVMCCAALYCAVLCFRFVASRYVALRCAAVPVASLSAAAAVTTEDDPPYTLVGRCFGARPVPSEMSPKGAPLERNTQPRHPRTGINDALAPPLPHSRRNPQSGSALAEVGRAVGGRHLLQTGLNLARPRYSPAYKVLENLI